MITIETLKELKEKSQSTIEACKEQIWKIENQIQFENAKIAVCDEMIAMEEAKDQPQLFENCESNNENLL